MDASDQKSFWRKILPGIIGVSLAGGVSVAAVFSEIGLSPVAFAVAGVALGAVVVGGAVGIGLVEAVRAARSRD